MNKYNDIQFYHNKYYGTIAVECNFTKEILLDIFNERYRIDIKVGSSYLNPEDNFCKKTGRDISLSRLESLTFKPFMLTYLEDPKLSVITFKLNNDSNLILKFRLSEDSDKPHLIEAFDARDFYRQ